MLQSIPALQRVSEEMRHKAFSGDRLEIKVLIIHSGPLPGNRPPLSELVCWLRRREDEKERRIAQGDYKLYQKSNYMYCSQLS